MEHIRQTSHHLRLVIVGSVVEIVNDLLRQRVEGTGNIQFLHGVNDDVADGFRGDCGGRCPVHR